jgi:ribosomal protein L36
MFIPVDEPVQELGEINMTFEGDTVQAQHTGATEGVASAVKTIERECYIIKTRERMLHNKDNRERMLHNKDNRDFIM